MLVFRFAFGGVRALFGLGAAERMAGRRGGLANRVEDGSRDPFLRRLFTTLLRQPSRALFFLIWWTRDATRRTRAMSISTSEYKRGVGRRGLFVARAAIS